VFKPHDLGDQLGAGFKKYFWVHPLLSHLKLGSPPYTSSTALFCPDNHAMSQEAFPPLIETPLGRYRHYKGMEYDVVGTVRHSETLEPLTLYRALYGEHGLWVRPAAMFNEDVIIDGVQQPRFRKIS
jgi:hypothetical protein